MHVAVATRISRVKGPFRNNKYSISTHLYIVLRYKGVGLVAISARRERPRAVRARGVPL